MKQHSEATFWVRTRESNVVQSEANKCGVVGSARHSDITGTRVTRPTSPSPPKSPALLPYEGRSIYHLWDLYDLKYVYRTRKPYESQYRTQK